MDELCSFQQVNQLREPFQTQTCIIFQLIALITRFGFDQTHFSKIMFAAIRG